MSNVVQEDMTLEDNSKDPSYGIAHEKLIEYYNPYIDVLLGGFGLVRPVDTSVYPAWMG
jgi:hypothetical protein